MPSSSTSDEEDNYLGTKKFGTLQAQFNNFYQNKKLDESDEDQSFEAINKSPIASPNNNNERSTCRKKNTEGHDVQTLSSSDDEAINSIPSTSFARTQTSPSKENKVADPCVIEDATPNKFLNTDDVLKHLDKLAETAKELSEDYNAAIYGKNKRKGRSRTAVVPPVFLNAKKGKKRTRSIRNSARLARLKTQLQLQSYSNCNVSYDSIQQNHEVDDNSVTLIDSDSNDDNSAPTKHLKEYIETTPLNPTVHVNINWRCDSEITHKISVFKFQCLSCVEAFCSKEYNINPKLILFTIEDKPVHLRDHCYASLRLTETTVVDGGVLPETYLQVEKLKVPKEVGLMKLKVQYVENAKTKDFPVQVRRDDSFGVVFWLIIKELDCDFESISLRCDGVVVKIHDTIESMDLQEEDCLDLTLS